MTDRAVNPMARAIAISAFAALIGLLVWLGIATTNMISTANAALADERQTIAGLEQRLANLTDDDAGAEPRLVLALDARNQTLAGAEMQDLVLEHLATYEVVPALVDIRFPEPSDTVPDRLRPVELDLQFEIAERDLPLLLYRLETGNPVMQPRRLSVDRANSRIADRPDASVWQVLSVAMTIQAYWVEDDSV